MSTLTKKEYLDSLLKDLKSTATRFKRASDDQDLLLRDLQSIEKAIERIQEVKDSDQEFYTWYEIEKYKLSCMAKDLKEISNGKQH